MKKSILKHLLSVVAFSILLFLAVGSTDNDKDNSKSSVPKSSVSKKKWYQGGTLHKATIGEWKTAAPQNKLATAADWLAGTEWKGYLNSPSDFDKLKICAQKLANAVDKTVQETDKLNSSSVTEIAAILIQMSYDLKPQHYK